ncbi:protein of unknown function DUF924 (plasmid) [Gloeothece citriformis PCC 7424]|uniref:DUF924 domain-containing protein n=1 Tax=Gloeothece citriformis (strain PCC 7424) TaxID=65393 RepID=B7KMD5_GLOC7|nr:DUF924 family protein [Gloeothece citriformis]ACK73957.1 protein of unknown function DUF924 [Gloeothece citriformis PCC 7424]
MNFESLLAIWFGSPDEPGYGKPQPKWFTKNSSFDQQLHSQFFDLYKQAATGHLDPWKESPLSCLALIILLDQFPRNVFRGQPLAFATDEQALNYAMLAVKRGYDRQLLPLERWFIYLPFEHSESLAHQQQSVELFLTLKDDPDSASAIDYALRHLEVIERFGRFPHRNSILNRPNTPEEEEFLSQPGSSF